MDAAPGLDPDVDSLVSQPAILPWSWKAWASRQSHPPQTPPASSLASCRLTTSVLVRLCVTLPWCNLTPGNNLCSPVLPMCLAAVFDLTLGLDACRPMLPETQTILSDATGPPLNSNSSASHPAGIKFEEEGKPVQKPNREKRCLPPPCPPACCRLTAGSGYFSYRLVLHLRDTHLMAYPLPCRDAQAPGFARCKQPIVLASGLSRARGSLSVGG